MRGPALRVPRAKGEETRQALRSVGVIRDDVEVVHEGDWIAFPLLDGVVVPPQWGEVVERELRPRRARGPTDYRELLHLPPTAARLLPRSFDVVGDMVVVRLPDELASHAADIGRALLEFVPGARIVGSDHGVHGADRRRSLEVIAGSGGWKGRHRENGIEMDVDLEKAYFSPRLAREHARVAESIEAGDRVYDLCCGVGPFSLTFARDERAQRITAVDTNPEALALLRGSLERLGSRVPVAIRAVSVESFSTVAEPVERVVFNLPLEGIKYLPSVARTVALRGHLWYYEVVPRRDLGRRGEAIVRALGRPGQWEFEGSHVIHPYSPAADLVAFELARARAEAS